MKRFSIIAFLVAIVVLETACTGKKDNFDATGSFEAVETIIAAEAAGTIKAFDLEEGQVLASGQVLGYIDSTQLWLKKQQLEAQVSALLSKKPEVSVQLAALMEQLRAGQRELQRLDKLVKADAATTKQLDDANAAVAVIERQIEAQKSTLQIATKGFGKDAGPITVQIYQLNDQLDKCTIVNPVNGTVLTKYAEVNESTAPGRPLYKIADLSTLVLRVYISAGQLPEFKLNQKVKVLTDDGKGGYTETEGIVTWISEKAEFTPKTIQTKDERANLVYGMKVLVKNDGTFKIGMYGQIKF